MANNTPDYEPASVATIPSDYEPADSAPAVTPEVAAKVDPGFVARQADMFMAAFHQNSADFYKGAKDLIVNSAPAQIQKATDPAGFQKASDFYDQNVVAPIESASKNFITQVPHPGLPEEISYALGRLPLDIAEQMGAGLVSKLALSDQLIPKAAEYFAKIPDLAVGMGVQAGVKAGAKGEGPVLPAAEGVATGLLFTSVGNPPVDKLGRLIPQTELQNLTRHLLTVPQMASIGAAQATFDALKKGRFPTNEEVLAGSAMGGAMAVLFAALPVLKSGLEVGRENALDALENSIKKAYENKHGFNEVLDQVAIVIMQPDIPEPIQDAVDMLANYEVTRNPETGELLANKKISQKTPATGFKKILRDFLTKKEKLNKETADRRVATSIEEGYLDLGLQAEAREILAAQELLAYGVSDADAEAAYNHYEDMTILQNPSATASDTVQKVVDDIITPLVEKVNELKQQASELGVPMFSESIPRTVLGMDTWLGRIQAGKKSSITGNVLSASASSLKKRIWKIIVGPDGERVVARIADKKVVAYKNGVPTELGPFSMAKNIDRLKEEIKPLVSKIQRLRAKGNVLKSVNMRAPVSKAKMGSIRERLSELQAFLGTDVPDNPELRSIHETFQKEIDGLSAEISKGETVEGALSKFKGDSVGIDKAIAKLWNKMETLYTREANLNLSDIYEKTSDFINEHEAEVAQKESADVRALATMHTLQGELKAMEDVAGKGDLILRARRLNTLETKIDGFNEEINNIISRYELEDMENKTFRPKKLDAKGVWRDDPQATAWTVGDATVKEIEANTAIRYAKNPILNLIATRVQLERVIAAKDFRESIKSHADFSKIAVSTELGLMPPEGWKRTTLPGFESYYLDPRVADAMAHIDTKMRHDGDLIETVNSMLVASMFINSTPHIHNVAAHWFVARGWQNFNPLSIPTAVKAGARAVNAVWNLNSDYVDMLTSKVNLLYYRNSHRTMQALFEQKVMQEFNDTVMSTKDPLVKTASALRQAPVELTKRYFGAVREVLWAANDVLTMQHIFELEAGGMSREKAVAEAADHIPNYVLPSRILGNRKVSELMGNPYLTMFGPYHYGLLKSFGRMLEDTLTGSGEEKVKALGHVAALAVLMGVIYPQVDKVAKNISGNPDARVSRGGGAGFADAVLKFFKGKREYQDLLMSLVTPNILTKFAVETWFNTNLSNRKRVIERGESLAPLLEHATKTIAPVRQAMDILAEKKTLEDFLWSQAQIISSDEDVGTILAMQSAKDKRQEEVNKIYSADEDKGIKAAEQFNAKQEKDLAKIYPADSDGYSIMLPKVTVTRAGEPHTGALTKEKLIEKRKAGVRIA